VGRSCRRGVGGARGPGCAGGVRAEATRPATSALNTRLYLLAFDHRGSFEQLVGDAALVPGAKRLIWDGFLRAVSDGVPAERAGILVDAQYGSEVAQDAKAAGFSLAMPAEKSDQAEFRLEYGDRFGEMIEQFDPDFTKVLVRYNPSGDAELNARQTARLALLSAWLRARGRKLLFELLVPPEPSQTDLERFDRELRPELMLEAAAQLQAGGVEPDVWKIEGIDDAGTCRAFADFVRREGRDSVACLVLGRAADDDTLGKWLRVAASVDGYAGFAIGRSIFVDAVKSYAADPEHFDREAAVDSVARNYRRFVDLYDGL
jgi:myo-inositol catabolism protein IolC